MHGVPQQCSRGTAPVGSGGSHTAVTASSGGEMALHKSVWAAGCPTRGKGPGSRKAIITNSLQPGGQPRAQGESGLPGIHATAFLPPHPLFLLIPFPTSFDFKINHKPVFSLASSLCSLLRDLHNLESICDICAQIP